LIQIGVGDKFRLAQFSSLTNPAISGNSVSNPSS
jgi:hypothetical protein